MIESFLYLSPRDLLILLGPDDLGQLWGHVELHLEKYQDISCSLGRDLDKMGRLT